jgi:hypothetical protein
VEVRTPQRNELGPKIHKEAWKEDWRQNKEQGTRKRQKAESRKQKVKDTAGNW